MARRIFGKKPLPKPKYEVVGVYELPQEIIEKIEIGDGSYMLPRLRRKPKNGIKIKPSIKRKKYNKRNLKNYLFDRKLEKFIRITPDLKEKIKKTEEVKQRYQISKNDVPPAPKNTFQRNCFIAVKHNNYLTRDLSQLEMLSFLNINEMYRNIDLGITHRQLEAVKNFPYTTKDWIIYKTELTDFKKVTKKKTDNTENKT